MRFLAIFAALFIAFAPLGAANAGDISKSDVSKILEAKGFNVQEFGNDALAVQVAELYVLVWIAGPDADISFITTIPGITEDTVSHKVINDFNTQVKFGRAYLDPDGDLTIQMDRNATGGISAENIESDFEVFLALIDKFLTDLERQKIA